MNASRHGFTLIEATLSVAIVGILLATSAGTFSAIAQIQRFQAQRQQGYMLAQQLMTEIQQTYFQDPASSPPSGSSGGGPRTAYNGVSDYNALTESPPTLRDGTALTDYTGWTRSVAVCCVDPTTPSSVIANSTLKRITVTVTTPAGKPFVLVSLRSSLGEYETAPAQQTNYVTGVGISMKSRSLNKAVYTTAEPMNVSISQ